MLRQVLPGCDAKLGCKQLQGAPLSSQLASISKPVCHHMCSFRTMQNLHIDMVILNTHNVCGIQQCCWRDFTKHISTLPGMGCDSMQSSKCVIDIMSVCAYHDCTPDKHPEQDVSCIGTSLQVTLKISRILHAKLFACQVICQAACMLSVPAGRGEVGVVFGGGAYDVCY